MIVSEYKGYDIFTSEKHGVVECRVRDGLYILAEFKMICQSRKHAFDMLKTAQETAIKFINERG